MKAFKYFLFATLIVTFLLVVIGNVVRVSDAALACPDWPTCYGQLGFPADQLARLQVTHRLPGGAVWPDAGRGRGLGLLAAGGAAGALAAGRIHSVDGAGSASGRRAGAIRRAG